MAFYSVNDSIVVSYLRSQNKIRLYSRIQVNKYRHVYFLYV